MIPMKANIKKKNQDIYNKMNAIAPMDNILEEFIDLMELPEDEFDKIYDSFKTQIISTFESNVFRKEMIENSKGFSTEDIEAEKKEIEEFMSEIKENEDMSDHKKDILLTLIDNAVIKSIEVVKNPREKIKVKIEKINENAKIPTYAHDTDAGADIYSADEVSLNPHETKLISTGIKVAIPSGYELSIRPRSGLSLKTNLRIANSPATIDSAYRGEIKVIMQNTGDSIEKINIGDRIGQFIIMPVPMIEWEETTIDDNTDRGEGGFGSSGN